MKEDNSQKKKKKTVTIFDMLHGNPTRFSSRKPMKRANMQGRDKENLQLTLSYLDFCTRLLNYCTTTPTRQHNTTQSRKIKDEKR